MARLVSNSATINGLPANALVAAPKQMLHANNVTNHIADKDLQHNFRPTTIINYIKTSAIRACTFVLLNELRENAFSRSPRISELPKLERELLSNNSPAP